MHFLKPEAFFDLASFEHRELFSGCRHVWQPLENISSYLHEHMNPNVKDLNCLRRPLPQMLALWKGRVWREEEITILGGDVTKGTFRVRIGGEETSDATVLYAGCVLWDEQISLGPGCVIEPGALIKGPAIIGAHTEVRQGAYVRGKCIVGDGCVVGHTTEMKSSVMLNGAKAGHFAYIGDSILGGSSNLGAGTKLANLKIKGNTVRVRIGQEWIDTGLRKFGAILGDGAEIGCNAVTNPGALLARGCMVHPVTSVLPGYYEPGSVLKPSTV
jgi:carbonic anhydrase/acetyltransferase-like protein (isoleucine patch superfamily)